MPDTHEDNSPISPAEYKSVTEAMYKQNLELARLYKEVEVLNKDLEKANAGQTNLIHIINHQIKGYLSKSRNIFSELLSEPAYGPIAEPAKPMITEGFNSLTEGVDFVQQILNASNIEKGTIAFMMQPFDMKKAVEEVVGKQKGMADKKHLSLEVTVDDGDYNIMADNTQLKEAIRNLVDNSIIYTETGGLKIHLSRDTAHVLLTIKDTGIGLTPEDKAKLFQNGGRGKDSLRININSTGYGLAYVKGVAEAHHGRVWAESEGRGRGSIFSLELPFKQ